MKQLYFLIVVFGAAIFLSFYYSNEGFNSAVANSALQTELADLNKTMDYLRGVGINENSANVTFNTTADRIKEINAILNPAAAAAASTPTALLTAELAELNKTMDYLRGVGINENSSNNTFDTTAARIREINGILGISTAATAATVAPVPAPIVAPAIASQAIAPPVIAPPVIVAPRVPLIDSSGNRVPVPPPGVTVDASGNVLSNRLKDLISILTQSSVPLSRPADTVKDISNNSQPMPLDSRMNNKDMSNNDISQFYKMLKPQIHNDITNAVNKGFERSTVLPNNQKRNTPPSPAIAQGMAWPYGPGGQQHCGGQEDTPDMNEYIRKDSIPCWACDVKY